VGALLGDKIDSRVEQILGHGVESRWYGCDGNTAIEVPGNLLGGTDVERLLMTPTLHRSQILTSPTFTSTIPQLSFVISSVHRFCLTWRLNQH
jgi:hypothetical protein